MNPDKRDDMTTLSGQELIDAKKTAVLMRKKTWVHLRHPEEHIPLFEVPETVSNAISRPVLAIIFVWAVGLAVLAHWLDEVGAAATKIPDVPLWWVLPFVSLLGCIAIMPFAAKHFWEKNYQFVAVGLGLLVTGYYLIGLNAGPSVAKSVSEYISFIFLLASLFVVSGGILFRVRVRSSPTLNMWMLLAGALLANVFGTTGASVLMIRPFLKLNKGHTKPYHVVFFIFAVSNVGGALTPIGDPPLFLGYLKGVPFWWVLEHCWPMWSVAVGALLAIFWVIDTLDAVKHPRGETDATDVGPVVSLWGATNLIWISLVLASVFCPAPYREIMMALAAVGSLWTTPRVIHVENLFNYAPVREVAILFIGIFLTMVPALDYLHVNARKDSFKAFLSTPGQYYFMSGALSSVLDNAPTYLTYLETQLGKNDPMVEDRVRSILADPSKQGASAEDIATLSETQKVELAQSMVALRKYHPKELSGGKITEDQLQISFLLTHPSLSLYLIAISLGSVFFGACTYIGNGPNFMVKSIAEHADVKCPSFFGYVFYFTLPVLLPILILCWAIFLR